MPAKAKRSVGVKQEVYNRLEAGMEIRPRALASDLGCSETAVAHNIRSWEKEGNALLRHRDEYGHLSYVASPNGSGSKLPATQVGFLAIPQMTMPQFGQMLQVTGIGAFDNGRISVILRDGDGHAWAVDLTAQKQ